MATTPGNSINETTTGITGFTGTSFVGTPVTQYNVLTGSSTSSTINNVAPSATSGVPLISQGSSSQPAFGTAVVGGGGTGITSATAYSVIAAGTTSTGAFQSVGTGSSGQILRSGGNAALPSYSTATYPSTAGTSGNVLTSDGTNWVSSAPSSGINIQVATVTLTSSQIKNCRATPIEIVAAPGANKIILPLFGWSSFHYGGTDAFTNGQTIGFRYDNSGTYTIMFATGIMVTTDITSTTSGYYCWNVGALSTGLKLATNMENKRIVVVNTGGSEITGNAGNDNTLTVVLTYYITSIF